MLCLEYHGVVLAFLLSHSSVDALGPSLTRWLSLGEGLLLGARTAACVASIRIVERSSRVRLLLALGPLEDGHGGNSRESKE